MATKKKSNLDNKPYKLKENPESFQINNTQVSKEDYKRLKNTPSFVQSTYENPDNISKINQPVTSKQQDILNKTPEGQLAVKQKQELSALQEQYLKATPEEKAKIEQTANPEQRSFLSRALGITFGNDLLTTDLKTGQQRIDPDTGQPIQVAAGVAPFVPAGTAVGGIGLPSLSNLGKVKASIGSIAGISFLGVSANSIWSGFTTKKAADIEGDIRDLNSAASGFVTDVSRGGDPQQAIDTLTEMEDIIRKKEGELNLAVKRSKDGLIFGKDTQVFMFKQLNAIILKRQAIERYQLDHDANALALSVGIDFPEE